MKPTQRLRGRFPGWQCVVGVFRRQGAGEGTARWGAAASGLPSGEAWTKRERDKAAAEQKQALERLALQNKIALEQATRQVA